MALNRRELRVLIQDYSSVLTDKTFNSCDAERLESYASELKTILKAEEDEREKMQEEFAQLYKTKHG